MSKRLGEGALLRAIRPKVITTFAKKDVATAWDDDSDELDLESGDIATEGVQFVHVECTEDVFLVFNGLTANPTVDGVLYIGDVTHEIPCAGKRYLHYKRGSADGTLTVTAFGN